MSKDSKGWVSRARWGMRVIRQLVVELLSGETDAPLTIDTAPTTPIAELCSGEIAKVVGTVRCFDEPELVAPLCGRRCAYYRTRLYEADEQRVLQETGSQSFFVEDETGDALVLVDDPEVTLAMDEKVSSGLFDPLSDGAKRFLAKHDRASHKWVFRRDIRFEEGILEPGEMIAVFGRIRPARGGAAVFGGYRSGSARMAVEAADGGRLSISDDRKLLR